RRTPKNLRTQIRAGSLRKILLLRIARLTNRQQLFIHLPQHPPAVHATLNGSKRVIRDKTLQTHQSRVPSMPIHNQSRPPLDIKSVRSRLPQKRRQVFNDKHSRHSSPVNHNSPRRIHSSQPRLKRQKKTILSKLHKKQPSAVSYQPSAQTHLDG